MSFKDWLFLGVAVLNFAFVVWVYVQNRRAATRAEVAARDVQVERKIVELEREVALAKQGLCNAPNDGDLSRIHGRIDDVHGELKHVCGLVSGMRSTVDSISQYLMTERGK